MFKSYTSGYSAYYIDFYFAGYFVGSFCGYVVVSFGGADFYFFIKNYYK